MKMSPVIVLLVTLCCVQIEFGECSFNIESLFRKLPLESVQIIPLSQLMGDGASQSPSTDGNNLFHIFDFDNHIKQIKSTPRPVSHFTETFTINAQGPKDRDSAIHVSRPSDLSGIQSIIDSFLKALSPLSSLSNKQGADTEGTNVDNAVKASDNPSLPTDNLLPINPTDNPSQINPTDIGNVATITIIGGPAGTSGTTQFIIKESKTSSGNHVEPSKEPENPPSKKIMPFNNFPKLLSDIMNITSADLIAPVFNPVISSEQKPSEPKFDTPLSNFLPQIELSGFLTPTPTPPSDVQEAQTGLSSIGDLLKNDAVDKSIAQEIKSIFKNLAFGK